MSEKYSSLKIISDFFISSIDSIDSKLLVVVMVIVYVYVDKLDENLIL